MSHDIETDDLREKLPLRRREFRSRPFNGEDREKTAQSKQSNFRGPDFAFAEGIGGLVSIRLDRELLAFVFPEKSDVDSYNGCSYCVHLKSLLNRNNIVAVQRVVEFAKD